MTYVVTWPAPFPSNTGGGILPPSIAAVEVDNPPFVHPAKTAQSSQIVSDAQPPWQYEFCGAQAPYVGRTLSPAITAVPVNNPPFARQSQSPVDAGWTPRDPVQQAQAKVPPAAPASFIASLGGAIQAVMLAWQVVAPQPVFAARLNPSLLSVDNPPVSRLSPSFDAILAAWRPADPAPILPRYVPQAAVAFIPSPPAWLPGIIAAWTPAEPPQITAARLNPSIEAVRVDNPAIGQTAETGTLAAIVAAGQPDPSIYTFFGGRGPFMAGTLPPSITAVAVNNPPFGIRPFDAILSAWRPPDPSIAQRALLPPALTFIPLPPVWITGILSAWVPVDQPNIIARGPNPGLLSVDNPPFSRSSASTHAILAAWNPADQHPVTAPRLVVVTPFVGPPLAARAQLDAVLAAWRPADLPLQLPRYIPSLTPAPGFVPSSPGVPQGVLSWWSSATIDDPALFLIRPAVIGGRPEVLSIDPEYFLQYPDSMTAVQYPPALRSIQYPASVATIQYP